MDQSSGATGPPDSRPNWRKTGLRGRQAGESAGTALRATESTVPPSRQDQPYGLCKCTVWQLLVYITNIVAYIWARLASTSRPVSATPLASPAPHATGRPSALSPSTPNATRSSRTTRRQAINSRWLHECGYNYIDARRLWCLQLGHRLQAHVQVRCQQDACRHRQLVAVTASARDSLTADFDRQGPHIESQVPSAASYSHWRPGAVAGIRRLPRSSSLPTTRSRW